MIDYSFIKLFKNDFASAKNFDNPSISTLNQQSFIVQKPTETFLQISNSSENIAFVGGITVDLVDCCNDLIQNINSNFYYEGFVDSNGINQIAFEFGYIGVDYWTKPLYLRITDDTNGNIWYSNSFLVTDYLTDISSRFDYFNQTKIFGISYDLKPYTQSIRLVNCYDQTPLNKREVKQYITSQGKQVNYRSIPTFLRKYLIDSIDYAINDRLEVLFSHQFVYVNYERVVVSEFKPSERLGDTNFMNAEFLVNKQGETRLFKTQIFIDLKVIDRNPIHQSIFTVLTDPTEGGFCNLQFNKFTIQITPDITAKLYKNGVLVSTVVPYVPTGQILMCDFSTYFSTLANGNYDIVIEPNKVYLGTQYWSGFSIGQWSFEVASGAYENTSYNNDYLIN